ncbi:hypothetical protein [Pseudoclavibacter sp. 13-3]|uniref:hypothetical protein n=1 Tax=Pseudoclavibacter sp. 13-3 TaxID=2901228 RepID=UPI001E5BA474|nr:hypothetical protein [Pseudoclavibacter sp. 13-3]MCD7102223.1 hypothetical protein [Pseudoclavibacter sp. 13-3]
MTVLPETVTSALPIADAWSAETETSPSPSPSDQPQQDQEQIGAGPGAFFAIFVIAVLIAILIFDMVRRLRRMRYRRQARVELAEKYGVVDQEFPEGLDDDDVLLDPFERKKRQIAERDAKFEARAARREAKRTNRG